MQIIIGSWVESEVCQKGGMYVKNHKTSTKIDAGNICAISGGCCLAKWFNCPVTDAGYQKLLVKNTFRFYPAVSTNYALVGKKPSSSSS